MKSCKLISVLLVSLATLTSTLAAAAESQHHHPQPSAGLRLDAGKKWPTDIPLRQGMTALRGELAVRLPEIHQGRLSSEEYAALGRLVENQVGKIVSECKLEPTADAMLHVVVADLMHAAEVMQGKSRARPSEGAQQAVTALNAYGEHFDHPGWKRIE